MTSWPGACAAGTIERGNYVTRLLAISVVLLQACTSLPARFDAQPTIVEGCPYRVEADGANSFSLEVVVTPYSFIPDPDAALQQGRDCFVKTATALAAAKKRKAAPIGLADMYATANRNMDGRYLVTVTGKVALSP